MSPTGEFKSSARKAQQIVADAGGEVVGRTRLQKMGYILELAGVGEEFSFFYKHYGPYCEELAEGAETARELGFVSEEVHPTTWGGNYSIYTTEQPTPAEEVDPARLKLLKIMKDANAIVLELAATAALLAKQGEPDPWSETASRKPDKAQGRMEAAKKLYKELRQVDTPLALPAI
ncbi:hypothetical protein [Magnetofaba australis]|uniref:Uncharacterized protein n=1 Tax=Magnetofaba australis IT-1 TaxID=1434232 RepID=A0A1Y2JZ90_9PROT|nr:hypothetical protein [Magnetofaba australis]OSM00189.1 hypothetical protein MAIT1_00642 [Magnetofaba australis IT-1]